MDCPSMLALVIAMTPNVNPDDVRLGRLIVLMIALAAMLLIRIGIVLA